MGKRFVTACDIDELVAAGERELSIDVDTVLTDVARERARERGLRVVHLSGSTASTGGSPPKAKVSDSKTDYTQLAAAVKKAVVSHLGSEPIGLDAIISAAIKAR